MARVKGKGTALAYDADGTGEYTAISNIVEITPPIEEDEDIDTTHMASADDYEETEGGYIAASDCLATVQFDKTEVAALYAQLAVEQYWKITYAGGSNEKWFGFLSGISPKVERAGIVTIDIEVAASGRVVSAAS